MARSGKKVFAVVTHEGSGFGKAQDDLRQSCIGAEIGDGLTVFGGNAADSRPAVEEWVRKNHL